MKKIYSVLLCLFVFSQVQSQSDNCSGAVALTIGSCVTGSPGATQNLPGCVGNADDDAWYKFVATNSSHLITVTGSAGYDPVIQLLSGGTCGSLTSLNCVDNTFTGQAETINATGLSVGVTYYLRVYDYYTGTSAGTFTTCVNLPPVAPANNNCIGATALTVNGSCVNTAATSYGATQSLAGCSGSSDDDVWFMFTATNYTQTIQVAGSAGMDAVVELFSGTCASLTSIACQDATFSGGTETISASGLVPGSTYFVRVYDYYSTGGYPFSICITGASIVVGTQPNDEPCNAIQMPPVTADCNYLSFSNVGATTSAAAAPTGCTGGTGGFTATTKDVWFKITVPASGNLCITPQPNLTPSVSVIDDGAMALYSGACGSLTQIACSDDADASAPYNYPGTVNDFQPYINATGLTPGSTVYLRYWGWGSEVGSFGLCVQAPTNDACANALYICDINGYSASTSPAYTPDRPGTGAGQMYANNETAAGVNQPDGTNTGGPFGYYPPSNIAGPYSSPAIDVNIENNSWIRFTAGNATVNLRVTVGNCWVGNYPAGGIQMQIFSGTNCNNFVPVSSFREGSSTFTVTGTGLTVGNDYYLMVDGYARDICNYTIQALDGVALPEITAVPDSICPGQSSLLTAPLGATGYTWYPSGSTPVTTRTISVSPGTTMTYTCIAGGVCGQKQTLTKTVYVKTVPTVLINSGNPITTCGTQTITLTGSGANTYTWSTGNTTGSFTTAPVSSGSYSVVGRASNGCTNTAVTNVTVNPVPNISISGTNTICIGQSTTLTASGGTSYTWTPGGTVSPSITVTPTTTTVYNVVGTNSVGCTKTATIQVVVNGLPTVSSTSVTICRGNSGTITASGASTYTWGTSSTSNSISVSPTVTTTYTVTGTNTNGCSNTAVGQVSVNALPTVQINSGNPVAICNTQTVTLTGSGGITYTWSTGSNSGNINVSPTSNTTYTLSGTAATGCTNTAVTMVTVNALPSITITGPGTVCNGKSIVLTGNGGVTYTWTPGGAATSITVSPSSNTTYTVTGTGANGCPSNAVTTVTVNALPVVSVNNATVCNGSSVLLTASGTSTSYVWNTGATTSTLAPAPSTNTNYTVTGTAANSCTNAAVAQVTVIALPTVSVPSATICQNSTQVLTATGANTYTWSTSQNGPSISLSPTVTTTYTVTGVAVSSCSNITTVQISVNPLPQLSATPSVSPSNCGASTGSITNVNATGTAAFSYTWTNGATNVGSAPNLNNQPAGTYNLQIRDGNGCLNTFGPYSITNPGAPAAPTANATATSVCVGQAINFNANSASGGTYNWSGPNSFTTTTQNPSIPSTVGANGGVYSVYMTVAGCSGPATNVTVAVNALPAPNAASSQTVYCAGNTVNFFASSATSYTWTGPGSFNSNSQNPSITNASTVAAGTYTLRVTNASGCLGTTTLAIGVNTNPVPTATANPAAICAGQTINLAAGGGSSYTWSGPNGYNNSTQSPTIPNSATVNAGTYTVVVTGANTCTASAVTTVSINALPTFTSSVNGSNICNGAAIQFNAGSSANTYSWTGPGSFSANNNASPFINNAGTVNSGTYTLTVNSGSCTTTQTLAVNVYPAVSLTATATSTAVCQGTTLQLLGNGGGTYQWNGPGSFSSTSQSPQITNVPVTASGIYTLSVMDGNNCPGTKTVSVLVNVNPTATASANPNVICVGNTINLNAGGGTSYSWSGPNGYTNTSQNPSISNGGSTNVGDYTVTVTDGNSCSSTAIASVTIVTLPTFTMSNNASDVCYGGTIQFNAGSGPYTYSWLGPNAFAVASSTNPAINNATPSNSGTYTVTASAGSCAFSQTIAVNVYPQIMVNASATNYVLCSGSVANLNGTGGGTYSWTGPNNFSTTNQNPQIPNVQPLETGIYTLTVTDNTTNCSGSDTVQLIINAAPVLLGTSGDSTCYGQQLNLGANFGTGVTVNWYSDAALTNLVQANSNTYQTTPSANGTYTYYVQGVIGSCKSSVAMVTGHFYNINAIASADVYTGDAPLSVNFTGSNSTGVTSTDSFNWNFGDNTGSTIINPNHVFTTEATYTIVLTVTDVESGCLDTATVIIKVEDDLTVVVPNVFTPNNDGVNDLFHVKIKGAKSAEGFIYNRWGQLLFSWDVLNASWDGIAANGENCPDATYYYLIKVVDKKDKEHLFPGFALLVR